MSDGFSEESDHGDASDVVEEVAGAPPAPSMRIENKRDHTFLNRAASAAEAHFVDQRTSAAGASYQESAEKEAAGKEAASEGVGGSRSKCATQTTDVAYGLRLSHSVDEDDVAGADKRDEAARMGQYTPTPQHSRSFGPICPRTVMRLCHTGTACEAVSRSCTPFPSASYPSTRPSTTLNEIPRSRQDAEWEERR
jgi:hypothetical protein